ncbi:uncharacterized protein LAESUDRAFT_781058 [Laetiporus sulphureus 93-53]|uniref:Uncharacterized protein n=1 Tax=Laetiporus sulphureus 93-53 TaxID=1314785 RepID=A0A165DMN4_9APHY|nr:uncharacterized protein LAESUDRAFT_781058 [Laetiporus sulphureus 93-53]KZT05210.1 hypothetical protein LAESUDRAFT_781058 [Laetiporus sulphureus 93-53]
MQPSHSPSAIYPLWVDMYGRCMLYQYNPSPGFSGTQVALAIAPTFSSLSFIPAISLLTHNSMEGLFGTPLASRGPMNTQGPSVSVSCAVPQLEGSSRPNRGHSKAMEWSSLDGQHQGAHVAATLPKFFHPSALLQPFSGYNEESSPTSAESKQCGQRTNPVVVVDQKSTVAQDQAHDTCFETNNVRCNRRSAIGTISLTESSTVTLPVEARVSYSGGQQLYTARPASSLASVESQSGSSLGKRKSRSSSFSPQRPGKDIRLRATPVTPEAINHPSGGSRRSRNRPSSSYTRCPWGICKVNGSAGTCRHLRRAQGLKELTRS